MKNKFIYGSIIILILLVIACSGNMKVEPVETTTTVEAKKTVEPPIKKEDLSTETAKELDKQAYCLEIAPIFFKMSECFFQIAEYSNNNNIVGVGKEIEKLKKLNKELQSLNEPKEFESFAVKIQNVVKLWEDAYLILKNANEGKDADIEKLSKDIEKANKLLDEAAKMIK